MCFDGTAPEGTIKQQTARLTALRRGWQTTLGFVQTKSLKADSFPASVMREPWEIDNNSTDTVRTEQKII